MAKQTASNSASPTKKRRWYHNIIDSYKVAKRSFPAIGWWLSGSALVVFLLFMVYGYFTRAWISAVFLGIGFALVVVILLLGQLVRKASYRQVEDIPGAAGAVLGQAPRGWVVEQEPVAVNPRTKDVVFRAIGRCGVVLVTEGPTSRVSKMVEEQKRLVHRVAPGAPIHVISTGKESNQVALEKILKHMRKLKKKLTAAEVNQVAARLSTMSGPNIAIPKGIDPNKMRPDRKAMRG